LQLLDRQGLAIKAVKTGLVVNLVLVLVKLAAGIVGHSYALVADAVESSLDVFSSVVVWAGVRISNRPASEDFPYGFGKADALAAAVVSFMLLGASVGIAVAAVHEILTPHHLPSPFTLAVIPGVILVKELLFRRVLQVGEQTGSGAVNADAWHHRSDAITSGAAFVGIGIALVGGPGWESADDWAALLAAGIIAMNGAILLRGVVNDLMDRMPSNELVADVDSAARSVEGVHHTEKMAIRRHGADYYVDLHVQANPLLTLHDAHILSGKVKGAIRSKVPRVANVLIHMEPFEG
jgi:cation diffusion facilitator family transporter